MRLVAPEGALHHVVCEASRPFVGDSLARCGAERRPIDVFLLLPASHHALGAYCVRDWSPDTGLLVLCVSSHPPPPPPPRGPSVGDQDPLYQLLTEGWSLDHVPRGVLFRLGPEEAPFEPHAVLHGALSDPVYAWCGGPEHRLGRSCLLEWHAAYPTRPAFARARAVVQRYQYAVVFLYGSPTAAADDDGQLQAILFHPRNGETCRVHFRRPDCATPARLMLGEPADV